MTKECEVQRGCQKRGGGVGILSFLGRNRTERHSNLREYWVQWYQCMKKHDLENSGGFVLLARKETSHVRLANPFKSSVLNSLRNVKRPVWGRVVIQEAPKVLLLELNFMGN